jgi:hypothetical protein
MNGESLGTGFIQVRYIPGELFVFDLSGDLYLSDPFEAIDASGKVNSYTLVHRIDPGDESGALDAGRCTMG